MIETETETPPAEPRAKRLVRSKPRTGKVENLVVGILLNRGRFLVEKRRLDKEADPGYVEIPGGHVEPGETLEEALRREMMEELGIRIEKTRMVQKANRHSDQWRKGRNPLLPTLKSGKAASSPMKPNEYTGNRTFRN